MMRRTRRPTRALLVLAALVTVVLSAAPALCHDDDACRSDPQHHTDLSCGCTCHMPGTLPLVTVPNAAAEDRNVETRPAGRTDPIALTQPEPPPRG